MRGLHWLLPLMLAASGCTFHTHHTKAVELTVSARELAPASVPLAPARTNPASQTEVVTKDGQIFRIEEARFHRSETELIARSDRAGLRRFPIGDVRRVVLVDVVERWSKPESESSMSIEPAGIALLIIVGVAAAVVGGFAWAMSGMR